MRTLPGRVLILLADSSLFAYAASWLVIGGLALPGMLGLRTVAWWMTAAAAFGLAAAIRLRAGRDPAARALARLVLLFGASVISNMGPAWQLLEASGTAQLLAGTGSAAPAMDVLYLWLPTHPHWLKFAAVLHFTAVYPRPLNAASGIPRAILRPALLWGTAILASAVWAFVDLMALPTAAAAAFWFSTGVIPVVAVLAVLNVRASYVGASSDERGRILGLLAAVLVALGGETFYHAWLLAPPPAVIGFAHDVAPLIALLLAVYTVFVRGGLSPQLVVRRTALYGLLSVTGIFTFAMVDEFLSSLLVARLGVSEGMVSTVTVAVLAVIFKPVHDRVSAWLNRRLATWAPGTVQGDTEPVAAPPRGSVSA